MEEVGLGGQLESGGFPYRPHVQRTVQKPNNSLTSLTPRHTHRVQAMGHGSMSRQGESWGSPQPDGSQLLEGSISSPSLP